MSFPSYEDEIPAWGATAPEAADLVRDALRKEQLLKDIVASQEDLRSSSRSVIGLYRTLNIPSVPAFVARVQSLQKEVDKLTSGNETLQMYIDNLTMQMAKRR
ncbi:hypothetical protein H0H93_015535 [Arthromyces matolae]|nr:hypothetical protein H0H93_015535 [Arthromyces matolae]